MPHTQPPAPHVSQKGTPLSVMTWLKLSSFNVSAMAAVVSIIHVSIKSLSNGEKILYYFLALFIWRYLRLCVNIVGFWTYKPAPIPQGNAKYYPGRDVTLVIPTVDPLGVDFHECITTCARNGPRKIIIVTAGDELYAKTLNAVAPVMQEFPLIKFLVTRTNIANKREQVAHVIQYINTPITVLVDDHVFWNSTELLKSLIAPFEDDQVGIVGTNKRVRRLAGLSVWRRFWNMLGCLYLDRHNFDLKATNAIDGGVFVISGRTVGIRTCILQNKEFQAGYLHEMFFFNLLGPLHPDDDNYITRFIVNQGWKIKIQYTKEAEIETTVGVGEPVHTKFLGQCRRWVRTTWRSNSSSLFTEGTVWATQPYCVYAVYLTSFTNFALFTDGALVYLFTKSSWYTDCAEPKYALAALLSWIVFSKTVKALRYFSTYPQDLWLFPAYVLFGYFHSFIKLWALFTFWDYSWSGRNLAAITAGGNDADEGKELTTEGLPCDEDIPELDLGPPLSPIRPGSVAIIA
ncbi:glycosyltransferase like family 2-domain-containing protein [Sordaria brevicollis]|uniref:Glycosyltransferase like family 2-domain-containing protein n=1 Tax=Sordaria brevicollis TaxID=83679 RepID=A0AAE0UB36_SORBR|nr:glycosyltransferase like family 2-domain-containing protein [Sordaria brevicollis]